MKLCKRTRVAILAAFISVVLVACSAGTTTTDAVTQSLGGTSDEGIGQVDATVVELATQTVSEPTPTATKAAEATISATTRELETQPDPVTAGTEPLVLRNGLVITASGADPIPDGAVVIEGGVITAVGTEADINFPEGALVIDVGGGTIMPGVIDARASDLLNRLKIEDGQINRVDLEVYLSRTLRSGVTTVRATGWDWQKQQDIAVLRTALKTLGNTVPTVVIGGTSLAHGEGAGFTQYYSDQTIGVSTAEEARQITEHLVKLGVDQINLVMAVGPEIQSGRLLPTLNPEQLEAIVETAHAYEKPVIAQAIFADELETVVAAGVDQVQNWPELAEPMSDELIETLVTHSVPLLSGFGVVRPQKGDVRHFLDAGGELVYGTFAPNAGPLNAPYGEFQRMMLAGDMTPMEIIEAATAKAAVVVGLGDQVGTLEVGKTADILILDGNPLEDLRVFRDGVSAVIKGGELVPLDT